MDDLHTATLDDPAFQQFMDALYPGWREWAFADRRQAAKRFNFGRVYGCSGTDLKKVLT